ncbi:Deoxyhypusine synthase [Candidatus Nitrosocaldus cavascurensis]|jgi:deoxyhypusine synthase|uniref:Deoxyhypusine synthase n=2 Tax=Candidatus Nitrosocaldaceae TaxID=1968910 RepID=A0A2K5AS56_9ARCH|nr:Deoxyhypusine synthase [Candidatus Nitrosocaldus cavascurensis]
MIDGGMHKVNWASNGSNDSNRHSFTGKDIPYAKISKDMSVEQLIELYASAGYNARRLGEAAKLFYKMIDDDATICLTVAGAMTPIGYGGIIKELIEYGFVDWIISTGANIYHDAHFAWNLPVKQGHYDVDDDILHKKNIVRIYDVYIKEDETLQAQDKIIQEMFTSYSSDNETLILTTAEISHMLGRYVKDHSKSPDRSFIASAYEYDVPVYISTFKDSSLALDLIPFRLKGKRVLIDAVREIIEQAAIVYNSKRNGALEIGGGVPKNTAQQTGPALDQILHLNHGGLDYIIQLTDARPDSGGLSGATLQEGKSWGKVKTSHVNIVTVYGDASITFPLLCLYAIARHEPRRHRRLYSKLNEYYERLKEMYEMYIVNEEKVKPSD